MDYLEAQYICDFPLRLHPVSEMFMNFYNEGRITTGEFLRYFSLPNSDYIDLAFCYISMILAVPQFG